MPQAGQRNCMTHRIDSKDHDPRVSVTPCKDGPLLVRGDIELRTQDGHRIETNRKTIALCRCGRSATKPFCDGSHKAAEFRAASEPEIPH
jgi:CDGSH-type Zn-finger protein